MKSVNSIDYPDFTLRMGRVGESVKLWWPDNIEAMFEIIDSLLSSDDFACPAGPNGQEQASTNKL